MTFTKLAYTENGTESYHTFVFQNLSSESRLWERTSFPELLFHNFVLQNLDFQNLNFQNLVLQKLVFQNLRRSDSQLHLVNYSHCNEVTRAKFMSNFKNNIRYVLHLTTDNVNTARKKYRDVYIQSVETNFFCFKIIRETSESITSSFNNSFLAQRVGVTTMQMMTKHFNVSSLKVN